MLLVSLWPGHTFASGVNTSRNSRPPQAFASSSKLQSDELVTAAHSVLQGGASLSIPSITVTPRPAPAP